MFIDSVHSERPCRICWRRKNIWNPTNFDNVWCMPTTCPFTDTSNYGIPFIISKVNRFSAMKWMHHLQPVIGMDGTAAKSLNCVLNATGFIQCVCVDIYLQILLESTALLAKIKMGRKNSICIFDISETAVHLSHIVWKLWGKSVRCGHLRGSTCQHDSTARV